MADLATLTALLKLDSTDFQKGLQDATKSLEGVSKTMMSVGKGLSAAVTVPLVAVGSAALAAGLDFEKATNTIRKETGATGEALNGLRDDMLDVYAKTTASTGDVAAAISLLNTRYGETGQLVQDVALAEIRLAQITGEDLNTSLDWTTRMFGDWAVATGDQVNALDELYRASQSSGISVTELATTVTNFGAPLRAFGYNFEEATALLAKWNKEGVNTANILPGMKIALRNFAEAGIEPKQGLEDLIAKVKELGESAEAVELVNSIFGGRAGTDIRRAILEGRFDIESMYEAIANGDDTLQQAAWDTATFASKLTIMRHSIEEALEPLGALLVNILNDQGIPILKAVGAAALELGQSFAALTPNMQKGILVVAAALAAIGPALIVTSTVISAVSSALSVLGTVVTMIAGAGGLAGIAGAVAPVAAVAAAIAAIGLIIVSVWNQSEAFRTSITSAFETIQNSANQVSAALAGMFAGGGGFAALKVGVDAVVAVLQMEFLPIWLLIKNAAGGTLAFVAGVFAGIARAIDLVVNKASELWKKFAESEKGAATITLVQQAIETLRQKMDEIRAVLDPVIEQIITVAEKLGEWVGLTGALAVIAVILAPIVLVVAAITAAVLVAIETWNALVAVWNLVSAAASAFSAAWNQTVANITGGAATILATVNSMATDVISALTGMATDAYNAGVDLVQGLINGIDSMIASAKQKAQELADAVAGAVKSFLGIQSPSKLMHEVGVNVAQGLANGIYDAAPDATNAATKLAENVTRAMAAIKDGMQEITDDIKANLDDTLAELGLSIARLDITKNMTDYERSAQRLALELEKVNKQIEASAEQEGVLREAMAAQAAISGENTTEYIALAKQLKEVQREQERLGIEAEKATIAIEKQAAAMEDDKQALIDNAEAMRTEIVEAEQKAFDERAEAAAEYAKNRLAVEEQLAADIEDVQAEYAASMADLIQQGADDAQAALDEYASALESKTSELYSWTDLFGAADSEAVSGSVLLQNLKGQVNAFDSWSTNIATLAARGIDGGLLEELRNMGPDAADEIAAFVGMTDVQLTEYTALWKTKQQQAKDEAVAVLADQKVAMEAKLIEIRATTNQQIQLQSQELQAKLNEMQMAAEAELKQYQKDWQTTNAEIEKNSKKTMASIADKFNKLAAQGREFGLSLWEQFSIGSLMGFQDARNQVENYMAELNSLMSGSSSTISGSNGMRAYASGGYVPNTGPALLHAGEYVLNASAFQALGDFLRGMNQPAPAAAMAGGGGTTNYITINSNDENTIMRALRRLGVK